MEETSEKNKKKSFTPTSDMFYIFFRFYTNTSEEISEFKKKIQENNSFILGVTEVNNGVAGIQVNIYVKEGDVSKLKSEETLNLYQSYVGNNGFQVDN